MSSIFWKYKISLVVRIWTFFSLKEHIWEGSSVHYLLQTGIDITRNLKSNFFFNCIIIYKGINCSVPWITISFIPIEWSLKSGQSMYKRWAWISLIGFKDRWPKFKKFDEILRIIFSEIILNFLVRPRISKIWSFHNDLIDVIC